MELPGRSAHRGQWTIRDLLLLTLSFAVAATIHSHINRTTNPPLNESAIPQIFIFLETINCGVFFYLLLCLRSTKKAFGRYLPQPGHWLIVYLGLTSGCHRIVWYLNILLSANADPDIRFFWYYSISLVVAVAGWLFALIAVIRHTGFWRLFFATLLVPEMLVDILQNRLFAPSQTMYFSSGIELLTGLVLLIPVLADLRKNEQRDWLHWAGIGLGATTFFGYRFILIIWFINR